MLLGTVESRYNKLLGTTKSVCYKGKFVIYFSQTTNNFKFCNKNFIKVRIQNETSKKKIIETLDGNLILKMTDRPQKAQKRKLFSSNGTRTITPNTSDTNNKTYSSQDRDSQRKSKMRPKPVFFWSNAEVIKWLRRHCQEYHSLYAPMFFEHDITGRSLVRITDTTLEKMGIEDGTHREELCREILKLKLKSDIVALPSV